MAKKAEPKLQSWEKVAPDTSRLAVPGGWIYQTEIWPSETLVVVSTAFVPSPLTYAPLGRLNNDPEPAAFITNQG